MGKPILTKRISVTFDGNPVFVDAEVYGRKGSLSPFFVVYRYKGRLITPFERRLRRWSEPLSLLFELIYRSSLDNVIGSSDLLKHISVRENPTKRSTYQVPVILTAEHGFSLNWTKGEK